MKTYPGKVAMAWQPTDLSGPARVGWNTQRGVGAVE